VAQKEKSQVQMSHPSRGRDFVGEKPPTTPKKTKTKKNWGENGFINAKKKREGQERTYQ